MMLTTQNTEAFIDGLRTVRPAKVFSPMGEHGVTYGTDEDGTEFATIGFTLPTGWHAEVEDGTWGEMQGIRFLLSDPAPEADEEPAPEAEHPRPTEPGTFTMGGDREAAALVHKALRTLSVATEGTEDGIRAREMADNIAGQTPGL